MKHAQRSESRYQLDAMLELAKSEPDIANAGDGWDADPVLFGVENGVLDLRTGTLRPGQANDRITLASPVAYRSDAVCPRFERFLREIFCDDEAVIGFIQRAVGYSLTGDTTDHALFLLHGSGRNGKSVLLNTLRHLVGEYALNLPFSAFEITGRSQLSPELALLPGKRLVTSSETNDGTRLNEAHIKAMTGGDPITANPKYVAPFEFQRFCQNSGPQCRADRARRGVSLRGTHMADQFSPAGHEETASFGRRHRAWVPEVVVQLIERRAEPRCRLEVPEPQHRIVPLFQRPMRLFGPVVQIAITPMDRLPTADPADRFRV